MPNAIAKLGRERTVATLARRLFKIDASDRDALARAERALLRANPRLRTSSGFRSGADIVVPGLSGVDFNDVVARPVVSGQGLLDTTVFGLREINSKSEDSFRIAEDNRAALEERLGDSAFVREARRALPEATVLIASARTRIETDRVGAKVAQARLQSGISEALEAVERLRALATPNG